MRRYTWLLVLVLTAACTTAGAESTTSTSEAVPTPASDPVVPSTVAPTPSDASTPVADVVVVEPPISSWPAIDVATPSSGGGTRPLLEWSPVEGADSYSVYVYDGDGRPYWATLTEDTSVFVGGPVQIEEDKPGPRVEPGSTWSVVALDEDHLLIATSGRVAISP